MAHSRALPDIAVGLRIIGILADLLPAEVGARPPFAARLAYIGASSLALLTSPCGAMAGCACPMTMIPPLVKCMVLWDQLPDHGQAKLLHWR